MTTDVLAVAGDLARRREPYALASVVWRRGPSSGKEGYRAIITPDGRVRGWVGGACAEPTVVREALRAIEEGTPRLLFLGPPEELASRSREGMIAVPISCQSEGALEIFVEPVLPPPHLVVVGRSPMVRTLAALGGALGWRTTVVDEAGTPEAYPEAAQVLTSPDLQAAGVGPRTAVVVATQGHDDEESLEGALRTPAAWVGVVASRRRAESLLGYLRDRGFSDEVLARVHAPAGLDLGPITHEEIAVAVLAELVQLRAAGGLAGEAAPSPPARAEAVDPVCGMVVEVAGARHRAEVGGETYYFCCPACRKSFEARPAEYLPAGRGTEAGGSG
jgi:xanthine dehydrogenase accessory factor